MTRLRITPLNGRQYDTADLALERLFQPAAQRLLEPFPRWMEQGTLCIRVEHASPEAQSEYETAHRSLREQGEWYRLPARAHTF
jgi:hypothetical protein